ncbi:MAG: Rrf2 family transcriptional regulator [Syntrophomonas sp.]|nr:Rrf2 family transcriptional regulator [Syntrophomonas sp.]
MQISTRGRYGLRAMVDLAIYSVDEYVALNNIAERQNISESYLEQLFSALRKGGLVKSIKGSQGGYALAYSPSKITVGAVLRLLEGKLFSVAESSENEIVNNTIEYCLSENVWEKINASICSIVDSITLEDLVDRYKTMNGSISRMFYI